MRIFLSIIIILSFFQNLSAQENDKMASRVVSADLLKAVMTDQEESTLLVVLRTYIPELNRINIEVNRRSPDSKNYGYLLRRKEAVISEKSKQKVFNDNLIKAFRGVDRIDMVYFIPDTALNTVLKTLSCECQTTDLTTRRVNLEEETFFYFQEGFHPDTRKSGYYFYSRDKKYLNTPFPDYISGRNAFESILKAFFPDRQSRKTAEAIVKRINTRFYRSWGNQLARHRNLDELRS